MYKIIHLDTCESTNVEAWKLSEKECTLVVADFQTHGKGRQGRQWIDPADKDPTYNLYTSLYLNTEIETLPFLPILAGLAAQEILQKSNVKLKWPNDIYIKDKKCGGILCESKIQGETLSGVVVGLGLNLFAAPLDIYPYPATNILDSRLPLQAKQEARNFIAKKWTELFLSYVDQLSSDGNFAHFRERYLLHSLRTFSVQLGSECFDAEFLDLTLDGKAVIEVSKNDQKIKKTIDQPVELVF